jgi:type I restriction enzyme M protein
MAIKKSELYSSLWKSCDELRGGMDASQYKDYVLVLLFVKYVSDKYAGHKDAVVDVPKGGSFADMVALNGDKEIGDKINKIIGKLAEANGLKGVIDQADFDDPAKLGNGKEMVDRLSNLVSIFDNPELNFSSNRADGDDLLGDAYEYLMRNFSIQSGKSKGQFYTPAEVSRIMAKVIGIHAAKTSTQTIYDPTCGSGSLLLKAHDEGKNATGLDLSIWGQENDLATWALARMNTFLHACPSAELWKGNTLSSPHFTDKGNLKTFDFVVANPPFSDKAWTTGVNTSEDPYKRFAFGVPPTKNGDYAYLLQVLTSLKSAGKGAIIMPHGVLFRGNAEADIRKQIVRRGYIKGIIGLPANLFYGTGIPACIVVLDKENAAVRKGIFMIDASKGFLKDGNKNRLREMDLHKIVDVFNKQTDIPKYSRMVSMAEIEANDFNLNLPRYVDSSEPEDIQDIDAHLRGGIPDRDIEDLDRYWQVFPSLRTSLFKPYNRKGYSTLKVKHPEIRRTIYEHPEFTSFQKSVTRLFEKWKDKQTFVLRDIKVGARPKALIRELSEDLLVAFQKVRLVDPYDVYQHLMDYWAEVMQDDVYLISANGWLGGARVREIFQSKDKNGKLAWTEDHDYKRGRRRFKADLIPAPLMIARYFTAEQAIINKLIVELGDLEHQLDELKEDQGGEGGLLEDVIEGEGDKRKITSKSVNAQLKQIGSNPDFAEEYKALKNYAFLLEKQATAKNRLKAVQEALDTSLAAKYPKLTPSEIKTLVVDDKWMGTLVAVIKAELDRVSQALTGRIGQLSDRYSTPLPQVAAKLDNLSIRVDNHLKRMGFVWETNKHIADKHNLIKTAIQQLVSGKVRLPEFHEEWEIKCIGEVFSIFTGRSKSSLVVDGGQYWVVDMGSVSITGQLIVSKATNCSDDFLRTGDLVMPKDDIGGGNIIGKVGYINADNTYILSDHVYCLRAGKGNPLFLSYVINSHSVNAALRRKVIGSAQLGLGRKSVSEQPIPFPSLAEQTAIAAVLSDIDAEITALEASLTKTRALKQGMMQSLL